jgi:hypothetical protein
LEQALEYAISLATEYGAELTMLHVTGHAQDLARAEAILAARTEQLDTTSGNQGIAMLGPQ